MEQQNAWLVREIVESNRINCEMDARLQTVEHWKAAFTSRWALLSAIAVVLFTAAISGGFKFLIEKFFSK